MSTAYELGAFDPSDGRAGSPWLGHARIPALDSRAIAVTPGIIALAISATEWRVCDEAWPANDSRSLLGFIEKKGRHFEVLQLSRRSQWFSFDSLDAATAHFLPTRPKK